MKKAWYILNYHDISWEENAYMLGIGGSFSPDIFNEQVQTLKNSMRCVSVQEGFEAFRSNKISEPLLSFWFDDGFTGVRKYAYPILEENNIKAAIAINSRFMLHEELFWRCKLSYLSRFDGLNSL